MSAELLLGKDCVEDICSRIRLETLSGVKGKLCAIGFDEPRWEQYASSLAKSAQRYGFDFENIVLEENVKPDELDALVRRCNTRGDINGIIIQQPLPDRYAFVTDSIDVSKDVDCLNSLSIAKLYKGESGFAPATPLAVIRLLDFYKIDLKGKNVVIVGRGNAVGKPLALLMLKRNATVTVCHTKTVDLPAVCRSADIIVSACGVAGLITPEHVSDKSIVIDVGLSFVDGKTCGDVAKDAYEKCQAVSPVPGGVGPVTRATLFENLLSSCKGAK